jgi:hypothetical protein
MTPYQSSGTALGATAHPDVRWKRWLRRVLLVVSCVCLVLGVITLWLRIQIDNTDRFARTIDPIASDAAIQEAVVVAITDGFSARLSEAQTRETLVDRQRYLAAPINALLTDYVEQTARSIVTSDEFQQFWVDAKLAIHPRLSAILTGSSTDNMTTADGRVSVDLAPLVEAVQARLTERGIDVFDSPPSDRVDASIVLIDSPELAEVQGIVDVLFTLAFVFPIVTLITLGGYLWLSHNRRGGVIRAGLAVATSMALLLVLFSAVRWRYLDGVNADVNRDAAAALFDIIGRYLRAAVRLIALLGLLVAGVAFATRPECWMARQFVAAKRRLAGAGSVDQTWVERNRTVLLGVLTAVTCLCLITPNRLSQDWWRAILLASLVSLALILLAAHSANRPEPASPTDLGSNSGQLALTLPPATGIIGGGGAGAGPATGVTGGPPPSRSLELSAADRELLERVAGALRATD